MANRIRVYEPDLISQEHPTLTGENHHYLTHVHRVHPGDQVILFGKENREAIGRVVVVNASEIELERLDIQEATTESASDLTLVVAVGKGKKLEEIVEATTALGVSSIIPFVGERSVARKSNPRLPERLRCIAVDASRQSGRTQIPIIHPVAETLGDTLYSDVLAKGTNPLMLDENGGVPVREAVKLVDVGEGMSLFCGPEGGWSDGERTQLLEHGAVQVSLGPRILRTELAATVAVALFERLLSE